jgi:hypothetical protein
MTRRSRQSRTVLRFVIGCVLVGAIGVLGTAPSAQAQERFGTISGLVTDASGAGVPGALVTLTNKATMRVMTVTTGTSGTYRATALEPGRYSIKITKDGFKVTEIPDVNLLLGRDLPNVNASLDVGGREETIQVLGEAPLIDTKSTLRGHNVPAEEFESLPKGRSFQAMAFTAPSVNYSSTTGGIESGFQVNGASAAENNYVVDGISVNSQIHGQQRQDAVFEYLQEVQVKTSGLSAEYGGALGGVISAVTKSGGNQLKGTFYYYYSGSALDSNKGLSKRLVIDPVTFNRAYYVQDTAQSVNRHEIGGSLAGPIVRDRLYFFTSLSPRFLSRDRDYVLDSGAVDANLDNTIKSYSGFGKLTYEPASRLRLNWAALFTPTYSKGTLNSFKGAEANWDTASSDPASLQSSRDLGYDQPQWNTTFTADYSLTGTTLLSLRAGYFRDNFKMTGVNTAQTYEYSTSSIGIPGVPAQYQQPAGYSNLRRTQITDHDLTTRGYFELEVNKIFEAGGMHNLRVGGGVQRVSNDILSAYPNGGFVTIFWDQTYVDKVTGAQDRGQYGYYQVDDLGTIGKASANILSVYLQDNWNVTSRLTLNLGLRAEREVIPTMRPDIQKNAIEFSWGDKLAPRLGAAYDVLGNGKLKAAASWGRYYDWTKYELVRGSFGGDTWTTRYYTLDDPDPTKLSRAALPGRNLWPRDPGYEDHRIPSFGDDSIDPDIKPMGQDVFTVGGEYQLAEGTVLGVSYVHTNLLRTIEDIGTLVAGSEVYIYGNPGEGLAKEAIVTGATPVFDLPKPKRNYDALEISINRRFSENWFVSASYVLSRLYGNYAGTQNTDEIVSPSTGRSSAVAQQLGGNLARPGTNASRGWDLDELMFDSHGNMGVYGRLPTDRPHVLKAYGSYRFNFGTLVGVSFYGASGTPETRSVWTRNQVPVLVDGRGSLGRTPFLTQIDLLMSHEIKLGGARRLRLEFNALNLFNQTPERHIFENVNRVGANGRRLLTSAVDLSQQNLQQGYDWRALLAATPDAAKPADADGAGYQDPRYGMGDIFNPGFSGRLSIRFLF